MRGWTVGLAQLQSTADVAANLTQAETLIRQGLPPGPRRYFFPRGLLTWGL